MLVWFVLLIYVFLIGFNGSVDGAVGDDCSGTGAAGCPATEEVCDVGSTDLCICDSTNNYAAGPVNTAACFLAIDLGAACTVDDQCLLGNGQTGSKCSVTTDCVCDGANSYVTSAGGVAPCVKDCGNPSASAGYVPEATPASTIEGATATVTCENGYEGTPTSITCQAAGTWTAFSGCTIKDCGNPSPQAGYSAGVGGTTYGSTKTVTCDTGNGYTGSPSDITCEASGSWTAYSGCTTGGTVDCGNPPSEDGYVPESSPASTLQGATASVTCAAGYTGTASQITCGASGSWSTYSGCSSGGNRTKLDFSLIIVLAFLMLVLI